MTPQQEKEAEWSRWMAAAQDGDRAAYERLLKDCLPYLRSIASRYHRTADRREDVVQDILLTLHRVRHTYDPARPFTHWLATIASRRSIDALRRRGRTEKNEIFDEQAYETFSDPEANREMSVRDEAPALQAAIANLPEGQREAVELLEAPRIVARRGVGADRQIGERAQGQHAPGAEGAPGCS